MSQPLRQCRKPTSQRHILHLKKKLFIYFLKLTKKKNVFFGSVAVAVVAVGCRGT